MTEFRFAQLNWLNATWLVLLCAVVLTVLQWRGRNLLGRLLSPLMQARLVHQLSGTRRFIGICLFTLSLLALVVALMRPQWGMSVQRLTRIDSQIMICLDVSKSMLAEDVVPNRLERAKAEIDSLLGLMDDGQQVGLTAFAGKAVVLCPMTTDFGFLRLILDETAPSSVGLGGTRIGEALQKAVAGFRDTGDVNRLILLITDGEDHDSFPLDAAQLAREKGVRIISIGFGDEAGSKIEFTDPRTGVRSFVQDRNGQDVVSRLDGQTLRDIALATEGAYIPAGTGALDLQSIYDAHIASLMGGAEAEQERVIRNEAYQWCVVMSLFGLFASWLVTSTLHRPKWTVARAATSSLSTSLAIAIIALVSSASPPKVLGQAPQALGHFPQGGTVKGSAATESSTDAATGPPESSQADSDSTPTLPDGSPRELFNLALEQIHSDPDRAEQLLAEARNQAGIDGELRYHALYNLGWVEVVRGDRVLESDPEQALKHLELSASRFRDAIRLRPDSDDARHNLEIISRRILELRDSLSRRDEQDLTKRLDELIQRQRDHLAELKRTSESIDPDIQQPGVDYRGLFRRLGVQQRQTLSDAEKLAGDTRSEISQAETTAASSSQAAAGGASGPADESDQAAQFRIAQLSAMLPHLERSVQRMSKARSFTRRMQSERAVLRWSAAMTDAKRGRDQLRDPIEVLGVLIQDANELARWTEMRANAERPEPATNPGGSTSPTAPAWLSQELLVESQASTTARIDELRKILAFGAEQQNTSEAEASTSTPEAVQRQRLLADIRLALPHIEAAKESFEQAQLALDEAQYSTGLERQSAGIESLMSAAEYFYDLRRLIEVIYGDQQLVQALAPELVQNSDDQLRTATRQLQTKNVGRGRRLTELVEIEISTLAAKSSSAAAPTAPGATSSNQQPGLPTDNSQQMAAQKARLEQAQQLVSSINARFQSIQQQLSELPTSTGSLEHADGPKDSTDENPADADNTPPSESGDETESSDTTEASDAAEPTNGSGTSNDIATTANQLSEQHEALLQDIATSVDELEELRRLFFTIVEHLRETAQRQSNLNDETLQQSMMPADGSKDPVGPLQARQQTLQSTAREIANVLQQQSEQAAQLPTDASAPSSAAGSAANPSDGQKLEEASQLVDQAQQAMQTVIKEWATPDSAPADEIDQSDAVERVQNDADESQSPATEESPPASTESDAETPESEQQQLEQQRLESVLENQREALAKLLEALALLDNQQNGQDDQPQPSSSEEQNPQPQSSPPQQQNMNAEQMLQAIRDREAQRRKDKSQANALGSGAVEKDW